MISHERFGELRLAHFLPHAELAELSNWLFMDCTWLGEALGFSEWLRLETEPQVLRSLALDFSDFPETAAASVLDALELPVRSGMQAAELRSILGDPVEEQHFVADRTTYEHIVEGPAKYSVSAGWRGQSDGGAMAPWGEGVTWPGEGRGRDGTATARRAWRHGSLVGRRG